VKNCRFTLFGWVLALLMSPIPVRAALTLADHGRTAYVILIDSQAEAAEKAAARDLALHLEKITGAVFPIREQGQGQVPGQAILVGQGALARSLFGQVDFASLDGEELVMRTRGDRLLLAGGRPRGTLYAVSRFLQDYGRVRWWTPWASRIPAQTTLKVPSLKRREKPAFEARDPYWYTAFQREWAVRNFSNSQSAGIPPELGDSIRYRGFVHTFYPLVPPAEHFEAHPEWFSQVKGRRTNDQAQLCLSNRKLREFMLIRVQTWLLESPEARILSVSQNDWRGGCECPECKRLDDAQGGPAGSLLDFVNEIADRIAPDFPHVAIDTLAYQYTRQPVKTVRPRPNVIVRLCSIECNFREPLDHPSNARFAADIKGWSKVCDRLYLWDYTTDFSHYLQPHPNWFVLGPNLRFFHRHHVRGVFEQGAYQSHGAEMAELRAWVLAQLLWNPHQDDQALIREFLEGYYGAAARPIGEYLRLMHKAATGFYLGCFTGNDAPFLRFQHLAAAEQLWRRAEAAVAGDAELLQRVRVGHLAPGYAWLSRWVPLQKECAAQGAAWPLPASRKEFAAQWLATARGVPGQPWTQVKLVNEAGLTPEQFVERFAVDPVAQP
jgi:hypothetical protein